MFHEVTIIVNLSGRTSLHYASSNGHESVVQTLVELGADIHAKDIEYPNQRFFYPCLHIHFGLVLDTTR